MIAWMQKHNKYLVVTIWIATIAFIGAGFVGWGSYSYGSKASAIAKVGDVEITQEKFDFVYRNLYSDFANRMRGNFDDKKAKELGLQKMVYQQLLNQSLLLNLAEEFGIVISDEELASEIKSTPAFMQNGKFNKQIYTIFLRNRGLKPKGFEAIVRDDLIVAKLMDMLSVDSVDYEQSVIGSILGLQDKIEFSILKLSDIKPDIKDSELKSFFEKNKSRYLTKRVYRVSLAWSSTEEIKVNDDELKEFYHKNSFNYTDSDGKELDFEKVKSSVERDYRLKKGKKEALLKRIALKKGKEQFKETKEIQEDDPIFSKKLWEDIKGATPNTLLKPKAVGSKYAIVKVLEIKEPRVKTFDEAKEELTKDFTRVKQQELIAKRAESLLDSNSTLENQSGFIGLSEYENIPKLSPIEKAEVVKTLFNSYNKKGVIDLGEKRIVYKIIQQRLDQNSSSKPLIKEIANSSKKMEFQNQLIRSLSSQYPVKLFVKGL